MWESNQIVYQTLCLLGPEIRPGVTTKSLDKIAEEFIQSQGARPAFKGFNGYPASICTSIDEQVVHGIPSSRVLKEGEIVGIDVGAEKDGYFGDAALTYAVGEVSEVKQRLMRVTEESLYQAIAVAQAGKRLSDIGNAVQKHVEANGFSVVRTLVGHGIGTHLHEAPEIPNYGEPGKGPVLKPGMCLAIEPMVNAGTFEVYLLEDDWTIVTADHQPSAHFEHTIVVTENDPLILSTNKAG